MSIVINGISFYILGIQMLGLYVFPSLFCWTLDDIMPSIFNSISCYTSLFYIAKYMTITSQIYYTVYGHLVSLTKSRPHTDRDQMVSTGETDVMQQRDQIRTGGRLFLGQGIHFYGKYFHRNECLGKEVGLMR